MTEPSVRLVADPYPPYQYEESGTVKGVDHDVMVEAFRMSGYEARTLLLPWELCLKSMEERSADGVYQIAKTPEREKQFIFSDLLRRAETALFCLKRSDCKARDPRMSPTPDFRRSTIGVLAGYSYDVAIDTLKPPNKIEVESHEQLIQGLRDLRFELALMDQGVAEYLLSKHHLTDISRIEGYTIKRDLFVAFRKNRADLATSFNSGFKRLRQTPNHRNIFESYGLTLTPTSRSS